jgi:hypothetical protein
MTGGTATRVTDARDRTDRQEDPMSALYSDEVRTEALFVSDVQRSQQPTPELIRSAVTATVGRLGETGCAELVAQEFGEHPDCALGRMQWARSEVRRAFDNS